MQLFFVEKKLTGITLRDLEDPGSFFLLSPMQHLFASMMNLNATFLVWKKYLTWCDIWKKLVLFVLFSPMQHLFASMMNKKQLYFCGKKLNTVRD